MVSCSVISFLSIYHRVVWMSTVIQQVFEYGCILHTGQCVWPGAKFKEFGSWSKRHVPWNILVDIQGGHSANAPVNLLLSRFTQEFRNFYPSIVHNSRIDLFLMVFRSRGLSTSKYHKSLLNLTLGDPLTHLASWTWRSGPSIMTLLVSPIAINAETCLKLFDILGSHVLSGDFVNFLDSSVTTEFQTKYE